MTCWHVSEYNYGAAAAAAAAGAQTGLVFDDNELFLCTNERFKYQRSPVVTVYETEKPWFFKRPSVAET